MNVVQVRSPFKIIINEAEQTTAQVKLYIWNKGDTEPTVPTYTFTKSVPSLVNRECVFNISNQLQEFIEPIEANSQDNNEINYESNENWCLFKVERYSGDGTTFDKLDETYYVGLNGFTDYLDGNQYQIVTDYFRLQQLNNVYLINQDENGYFNLLIQSEASPTNLMYIEWNNGLHNYGEYLNNKGDEIILYTIPYMNNNLDGYNLPCIISFYIGEDLYFRINTNIVDECKYSPVKCDFQNSKGGWEVLSFFKAQTNSINVKGSEFNLLPNETDYNPYRGQSKVFNLNGNQTIKLNTGWVDESYNILIRDLLLSETVLLDNKPVMVKTKSMTYKTSLKDKMINYEIDFDYAFDLINNVV